MESMRTLNTSLPTSSPKTQSAQPPEQLLQAFKAAALSVTNLYKTAASDQATARHAGYQEALDDLLSFLDKENLGLEKGEGLRVRRWATERLDGVLRQESSSESDDERTETEERARSSSPVLHRKPNGDILANDDSKRSVSPLRTESAPPSSSVPFGRTSEHFIFRSTVPYPQATEHDMDTGPDTSNSSTQPEIRASQGQVSGPSSSSTPSVRLQVTPRHSRSGKHGGLPGRGNSRSSASLGTLGSGAGLKRKIPFSEFFDISGLGNSKDGYSNGGGGGGKRGRYV